MFKKFIARYFGQNPPRVHVPEGYRLFRCSVHGENFPGAILALPNPIGFYATRYVAAENAEAAEMLTLTILKADPSLQPPEGTEKPKDTCVYFENIEEVPNDTLPVPNTGFSFYEMGT